MAEKKGVCTANASTLASLGALLASTRKKASANT
jgi:hypothetical protein